MSTLKDKLAAFLALGVAPEAHDLMSELVETLTTQDSSIQSLSGVATSNTSQISGVQPAIDDVNKVVGTIEARIAALEQRVSTATGTSVVAQIEAVSTGLEALKSTVAAVQETAVAAKNGVESHAAISDALVQRVAQLEQDPVIPGHAPASNASSRPGPIHP